MLKENLILLVGTLFCSFTAFSQTLQEEALTRALVAIKTSDGVYLSWRCLASDGDSTGFMIYRDGKPLFDEPFVTTTNYKDDSGTGSDIYVLKTVRNGHFIGENDTAAVWMAPYLTIPAERPAAGVTPPFDVTNTINGVKVRECYPNGQLYTFSPCDGSVGDVDGDGQYELIIRWDPSNQRDNSYRGYTGNVYLDCYKLNGKHLWRIDLGQNIRAGYHYTQFMVYDLDGDGKAEIACKTAPGTLDGQGKPVLMGSDKVSDDYRIKATDSNSSLAGIIISGPEYLTVFNGQTGAQISTVSYVPLRSVHEMTSSGWGDSYGNRSERYLACVAYLDGTGSGKKPSLVMCRGYYTYAHLAAWDFDGKDLKLRWQYTSTANAATSAYGQGSHAVEVADVDNDGCDEIVYGAAVIDHDGKTLYSTGLGHGDAMHVADLDPDVDGLEVFMVHENATAQYGYEMHNAKTGAHYWGEFKGSDIGRGAAADIDPNNRGYECWSAANYNVYSCKGAVLATSGRPQVNYRVYWDGDLQDEILDKTEIDKISGPVNGAYVSTAMENFNGYSHAMYCNGTKGTPLVMADMLGDWREEVVYYDSTNYNLLVFSTTLHTGYRVPTLMQDHIYRMGIVWENVAYNMPPHLGYYLPDHYVTAITPDARSGNIFQTVVKGDSIIPVVYHYKNASNCDFVGSSLLKAGFTCVHDKNKQTMTISGTGTKIGIYTFRMSTTDGSPATQNIIGRITVTDKTALEHNQIATKKGLMYDLMGRPTNRNHQIYLMDGKKYIQRQ